MWRWTKLSFAWTENTLSSANSQKQLNIREALKKKNGEKRGHCPHVGEGGQSQFINLAQIYRNLPGPQITQKLTLDTLEIQFFVIFKPF